MNFNKIGLKGSSFPLSIIAIAIFILTILPSASASFSVGNPKHGLNTVYGPSGNITGWINVSFSSEPTSSVFSDSRDNKINLSGILGKNTISYSCSPVDCRDDYAASDPSPTKTITLNSESSKIYGVKLTGNISKITSFKFTLDSSAGASCTSQVNVDLLDDSVLDARNTNASEVGCTSLKDYGCFNTNQEQTEFMIGTTAYCEKVIFSSSPGFFIGGWVKNISGSRAIKASVYDTFGGSEITSCILPGASSSGGEIYCSINYPVIEPKENYVCISYASGSGSGNYRIMGYDAGSAGCGFYGTPVPSTTPAAYRIFAQGKQFSSVGTIEINKSLTEGRSFAELAEEYIIEKYGSLNCPSSSGCVIPIKLASNLNQDITLRNLEVKYDKSIGETTETNFQEVQKTPAKATSSGFQKLYLDGSGFSVPSNIGNYSFSLKLNSQNVVSQAMEVKDVPIITSLTPVKTAAAFPTEFTVSVTSRYNLTGFSWNFGDATPEITATGKKATHAYNVAGVYNLIVKATDQRGLSASRTFVINVNSPKDLINSSLFDMERDLSNLETEILTFAPFYQDALNFSLNLNNLKQRIVSIKAAFQNASSEADYNVIVGELVMLKIPEAIAKSRTAESLPLFSGPDYVNLPVLQEIAGGNYSSAAEEGYINGVLLWQRENLDVDLNFNEFSGRYTGFVEPIARIFEITVGEKRDISYDYYLIMPELEGFKTDAKFKVKSGFVYINLKEDKSVFFSTTEDIDFTNLPAFISPAISRVAVIEEAPTEEKPKWTIFILVVSLLLVIGVVGYIIMQEWYKRKYENNLFKNRNDLYNMINYVNTAKKKGLKDSQKEENLKKAGWSSERIRYVMKRYAGKRTGMLEIPITKLAERAGGKPKNQK